MAKDRSLVRASDIGMWAFCRRAWWLAKVQNAPHENPRALEYGDAVHDAHGRQVTRAGLTQRVGLWLITSGAVLLLVAILYLLLS